VLDSDRVTGASVSYDSGYSIDIHMTFGSDDPTTYPLDATPDDADWEYYTTWRLSGVTMVTLNPAFEPLVTYIISLNYDGRGLLTGTTVERI
jgi:hypothetical protein